MHDMFMWMVHVILHVMSDSMEVRLCWGINVTTETHGKILYTIAILNSYLYESTNPVI